MPDTLHLEAPQGWDPATVVAVDAPPELGTPVEVTIPGLGTVTGLVVTHLYRFRCDLQPGDDWIGVVSPGTTHTTIVHQRDYRPAVSTEWAVGLGLPAGPSTTSP